MGKTKITEENYQEIFKTEIYPKLNAARTDISKIAEVIKTITDEYKFESKKLKSLLFIPCMDVLTLSLGETLDFKPETETRYELGWYYIRHWFNNDVFIPMKLINYGDLLNPNTADIWENTDVLNNDVFEWVKKEAAFILDEVKEKEDKLNDVQKKHLEDLVEGKVPFGLRLAEAK